jgi:hypothetical protein
MFSSRRCRLATAKLILGALIAAQMFGVLIYGQANEPAAESPAPQPDSRREVRRALREFDRFLDHHPLLEDQLRTNPQLTDSQPFLKKNPELRDFLAANPNVTEGLKIYPRYFLFRGLLREASAPVSFKELAAFKDLFERQPKLQQALNENPELIRDPVFLEANAVLRDFLLHQPALAQVFLPSTPPPEHK